MKSKKNATSLLAACALALSPLAGFSDDTRTSKEFRISQPLFSDATFYAPNDFQTKDRTRNRRYDELLAEIFPEKKIRSSSSDDIIDAIDEKELFFLPEIGSLISDVRLYKENSRERRPSYEVQTRFLVYTSNLDFLDRRNTYVKLEGRLFGLQTELRMEPLSRKIASLNFSYNW